MSVSQQQRAIKDEFQVRRRRREKAKDDVQVVPESPPPAIRPGTDAAHPVVPQSRDDQLQLLKDFDLNQDYGPCLVLRCQCPTNQIVQKLNIKNLTSMSRLERWERAFDMDLDPPQEVRALLLEHHDDVDYTECLWHDERGLVPAQ